MKEGSQSTRSHLDGTAVHKTRGAFRAMSTGTATEADWNIFASLLGKPDPVGLNGRPAETMRLMVIEYGYHRNGEPDYPRWFLQIAPNVPPEKRVELLDLALADLAQHRSEPAPFDEFLHTFTAALAANISTIQDPYEGIRTYASAYGALVHLHAVQGEKQGVLAQIIYEHGVMNLKNRIGHGEGGAVGNNLLAAEEVERFIEEMRTFPSDEQLREISQTMNSTSEIIQPSIPAEV